MGSRLLRTFWAIRPPPEVIEPVYELVQSLRAPCDKLGLQVAWVAKESLHITLKFIGITAEDAIAPMVARVEQGITSLGPFRAPRLFVQGLDAFPNPARPRILYVDTHGESGAAERERFAMLQASLESWLEELGYAREERPFKPHLTIGRVRDGRGAGSAGLLPLLPKMSQERLGIPFPISELILYQSRLSSDGAQYIPLHRLPCTGNPRRT